MGCVIAGWMVLIACADGSDDKAPGAATPAADSGGNGAPRPAPDRDRDAATPVPAACAAALTPLVYGFDGEEGWTHGVSDGARAEDEDWPFDPWTRGTAKDPECPNITCFGAERGQNYVQCQRGYLMSPSMDLSACAGTPIALEFKHRFAFWTGVFEDATYFDGGIVEISNDDGMTWSAAPAKTTGTVKILPQRGGFSCVLGDRFHVNGKAGFVGKQDEVTTVSLALPLEMVTGKFRVRFSQASGVSSATRDPAESRKGTAAGWRIDDVAVVTR